ncbi:MAG: DUF3578 domain-containing protein [Rhodospirillaceae bacterium]|nr:DUF3578 domain-containing protein [Rhodospirillaceae bacterium]
MAALPSVRSRAAISVRAGFGLGAWSPTPWLCLTDPRAGVAPQDGVYVGLTFRQDMAGFHVVLAQGRERDLRILGRPQAREKWARIAAGIRASAGHLAAAGFRLDGDIDLALDACRASAPSRRPARRIPRRSARTRWSSPRSSAARCCRCSAVRGAERGSRGGGDRRARRAPHAPARRPGPVGAEPPQLAHDRASQEAARGGGRSRLASLPRPAGRAHPRPRPRGEVRRRVRDGPGAAPRIGTARRYARPHDPSPDAHLAARPHRGAHGPLRRPRQTAAGASAAHHRPAHRGRLRRLSRASRPGP